VSHYVSSRQLGFIDFTQLPIIGPLVPKPPSTPGAEAPSAPPPPVIAPPPPSPPPSPSPPQK